MRKTYCGIINHLFRIKRFSVFYRYDLNVRAQMISYDEIFIWRGREGTGIQPTGEVGFKLEIHYSRASE